MKINFTGHEIEITEALRSLITKKFDRIASHFNHPMTNANVILSAQKLNHVAEITVNIKGLQINAKASSDDMYKAIDQMIQKLDKQLIKHKEKITSHKARHGDAHKDDVLEIAEEVEQLME